MKGYILTAITALVVLTAAVCQSATIDAPAFSTKRLAVAAGADYAFYSGKDAPALGWKKEFQAGLFGAYKLTPTLAATGSWRYGLDTKQFETKVGLRLIVWDGSK